MSGLPRVLQDRGDLATLGLELATDVIGCTVLHYAAEPEGAAEQAGGTGKRRSEGPSAHKKGAVSSRSSAGDRTSAATTRRRRRSGGSGGSPTPPPASRRRARR